MNENGTNDQMIPMIPEPLKKAGPSLGNLDDCLVRLDKKIPAFVGDTALSLSRMILYLEPRLTFYYSQILKQYGLNNNLWFAMLVIYSHEDNSTQPSEISNTMGLTKTSITRLSDELVARGLIARSYDKKDRRKVILKLTQKAINFINEIAPKIAEQRKDLWSIFSDDELKTLEDLTYRMIKRLAVLNDEDPIP